MSEQASDTNYPDVLGAITGGTRLNLDVVQCALALQPAQVAAGRTFEIVLVLQNAADIDVDVVVTPILPDRDLARKKGRFSTKTKRLRIGLRPAETGYMVMPVTTAPTTAPGTEYTAGLSLDIKRMSKHPQRVRQSAGGGSFILQELPEETQTRVRALRGLAFSVETGGKRSQVTAPFEVMPPALAKLEDRQPDWISLWTMSDLTDDEAIAQKVWDPAQTVINSLTREQLFVPMLKSTQEHFEACHYPLLPPEAIFITKMLVLVFEMGVEQHPTAAASSYPRWFTRLCRLLLQEPAVANQPAHLVTQLVYPALAYDAVSYGFTMLSTVTGEDFGTEDETRNYANDIMMSLTNRQPLDFARAYLPLVLGGIISNARVVMPRENIVDTAHVLLKALEKRYPEQTGDNTFIFEMTRRLIDRALDMST